MIEVEKLKKGGVMVIGTGVLARWAAQLLEMSGELVYGFAPTKELSREEQDTISILPPITRARIWKLIRTGEASYVIALTDPVARERMANQLFERVERPARSCIHDSVVIFPTADIGGGAIFFPYVVIGIGAQVGGYVVIESHSHIGAGVRISDFVNIGSGCHIGEECTIDSYAWIGRGSVIDAGIKIGKGAQILPGSIVRSDVKPGEIYGN
ncbi:MAG: hypothetical protein N2253_03575 [Bacteroidia bacterium]|nr:hypothetical protein [Bacteroidia bacterium]